MEWAKARARAARWREQVRLVHEEMRRVLEATRYEASRWNLLRSQRQTQISFTASVDDELDEGLKAYADEHTAMEGTRALSFELKWAAVRARAEQAIRHGIAVAANSTSLPEEVVHIEVNVDEADEAEDD